MSNTMWSYPIGAIVNMGQPLSERIVRYALPVTIGEYSYGPDIFEKWTAQELAAYGLKSFVEDGIPQDMLGGVPVDIEDATSVHRTYPNAVPDTEGIKARRKATILAALSALDLKRIRPTAEGDVDFLATLNEQAVALRAELAAL